MADKTPPQRTRTPVSTARSVPQEPRVLRYAGWIVAGGALLTIAVGWLAVGWLPFQDRYIGFDIARGGNLSALERARSGLRTSGIAIATAFGAATVGLLAWGRLELSRREHHQRDRVHLDDRFNATIELLGHDDEAVRLGALYALEALIHSDPNPINQQQIVDVICAYLRYRTTLLPGHGTDTWNPTTVVLPTDYHAAAAIALRSPAHTNLDLTATILAHHTLGRANFTHCRFGRATLTGCRFGRATLFGCWFDGATLTDCWFDGATLTSCWFVGATLTDCPFVGARLSSCRFGRATLTDCCFGGVTLTGGGFVWRAMLTACGFDGATLFGCGFDGATLFGCGFDGATLTDCGFGEATLTDCTVPVRYRADGTLGQIDPASTITWINDPGEPVTDQQPPDG